MGTCISKRNPVLPIGPESPALKSYDYSEGSDREECFIWSRTGTSSKNFDDFELECPFTGTQLSFEYIIKLPLFSKLNKTKKKNRIIKSYFAGLNGNLETVKEMIKNTTLNFNWCLYAAAINYSEKVLEHLSKYQKFCDTKFFFLGLCQGGHIEQVIELYRYYKDYINYGFWASCVGMQKDIMLFLLSTATAGNVNIDFNYGLYGACISDNIDNLIFVVNLINIECNVDFEGLIECALKMANSEIVDYLTTLQGLSKSNDSLSIVELISSYNSSGGSIFPVEQPLAKK